MGPDNIVFEDLHGVHEEEPVTVDLDIDTKDDGITRSPAEKAVGEDDMNDDADDGDGEELEADASGDDDEADDGASSDDEDDAYSKRVRDRISREKKVTARERERAEYWEQQAKQLAKDRYENQRQSLEKSVEQADSEIERTRTDLERAIEEGNTKEQVRLTDDLTNWKAKKARAEANLETLSPDGDLPPFSDNMHRDDSRPKPSQAAVWVEKRGDWYRQPGFERATRLANRLDKEVAQDGYDPATPDYFRELDRRIKAEMPDLYDDGGKGSADRQPSNRRPSRSPVAPVGTEGRQLRTRSSKVQLGEDDFANIRRFGMDPKDPEVLKEYARNKREAEARK